MIRGGRLVLLLLAFSAGCSCRDEDAARRRREAREADEEPPRRRHARSSASASASAPAIAPEGSPPASDGDTRLVYLLSTSEELYAFDPRLDKLSAYHRIGRMDCKSSGGPMSMAVDRKGSAWVFHNSRELFKVSLRDASCAPTSYKHPVSSSDLGMGFTAKTPGSKEEQLYMMGSEFGLGTIAMPSLEASVLGDVEDGELTGGPDGKLFVFLPDGRLSEVDRVTRKLTTIHTFQGLAGVSAYAFARYAGRFYVFTARSGDTTTTEFDPLSGVEQVRDADLGFRVVGAGQSTLVPPPDSGGPLKGEFPEQ